MPAYNSAEFIEEAVRSTLSALPSDSELVVGDDGSTDGTRDVLDSFNDHRLRIHSSAVNLGISATLNNLIRTTDSRFIARMDSDDICGLGRFHNQLSDVTNVDLTFSRHRLVNSQGKFLASEKTPSLQPRATNLALLLGNCLSHPTMLGHRETIEQVGCYQKCLVEDYDLWLRLIANGAKIRKTWAPQLRYRVHSKQISQNSNLNRLGGEDTLITSYAQAYREVLGSEYEFDQSQARSISTLFDAQSADERSKFEHHFRHAANRTRIHERHWLLRQLSLVRARDHGTG